MNTFKKINREKMLWPKHKQIFKIFDGKIYNVHFCHIEILKLNKKKKRSIFFSTKNDIRLTFVE